MESIGHQAKQGKIRHWFACVCEKYLRILCLFRRVLFGGICRETKVLVQLVLPKNRLSCWHWKLRDFPSLTPRMTRIHCLFVGSAGSDLSTYIYGQKGLTMDSQMVALLLHTGGADFQELYYTLIPEGEEKSLKESFEELDDYFIPKVNVLSKDICLDK